MTRESMRKLKAEIHKELVDFIFEETDTDDEIDELWLYVIELAQKELECGNKQGLTKPLSHDIIKKKQEVINMKKKDTMTIRREWLNEVLDTLEMLEEKAETNGESRLMYEMLKTLKRNTEIKEQGLTTSTPYAILIVTKGKEV